LQKRLGKRIKLIESSWAEELPFSTTMAALSSGGVEGKVWVNIGDEPVKLVSLAKD
jgi:hypothetical protein